MIKIYVGQILGSKGKWLDLPMPENELIAYLSSLENNGFSEYEIQDSETKLVCHNIVKLNEIAERFDDEEIEKIAVLQDFHGVQYVDLEDLEDLAEKIECVELLGEYQDDMRKTIIAEWYELNDVPNHLSGYIDEDVIVRKHWDIADDTSNFLGKYWRIRD